MEKIRGTSLGNWLVLEKWMSPQLFEGTQANDEIWLNRDLDHEELARRLKHHRDTYVTKEDFEAIRDHGLNKNRNSLFCTFSALCTIFFPSFYPTSHLAFWGTIWYFIVRKGDTNVQVELQNAITE